MYPNEAFWPFQPRQPRAIIVVPSWRVAPSNIRCLAWCVAPCAVGVGARSALGVAGADAGPRSLARSRAVHYYDRAAGATPAGDLILDGRKKTPHSAGFGVSIRRPEGPHRTLAQRLGSGRLGDQSFRLRLKLERIKVGGDEPAKLVCKVAHL